MICFGTLVNVLRMFEGAFDRPKESSHVSSYGVLLMLMAPVISLIIA